MRYATSLAPPIIIQAPEDLSHLPSLLRMNLTLAACWAPFEGRWNCTLTTQYHFLSSHSPPLTSVVPPEHAPAAGANAGSQLRVHTGAVPAVKQAVGHVALGVAHAVGQGGQGAARRAALCRGWNAQGKGRNGEEQSGNQHRPRIPAPPCLASLALPAFLPPPSSPPRCLARDKYNV